MGEKGYAGSAWGLTNNLVDDPRTHGGMYPPPCRTSIDIAQTTTTEKLTVCKVSCAGKPRAMMKPCAGPRSRSPACFAPLSVLADRS